MLNYILKRCHMIINLLLTQCLDVIKSDFYLLRLTAVLIATSWIHRLWRSSKSCMHVVLMTWA